MPCFFILRCEESLPRDGLPGMRVLVELGRCMISWEGVTRFPEGLCSREGKARDRFFWSL